MNKVFLHVGLPKTGSTFLQKEFFPQLSLKLGHKWFKDIGFHSEIRRHIAKLNFDLDVKKFDFNQNTFISDEGLTGFDPNKWDIYAKKNKKAFGAHTTILIIIRDPLKWLNSVFNQISLSEGELIDPNNFFLNKNLYNKYGYNNKFSVDDFSYENLINIYKKNFKKVIVLKFEEMFNFEIWQKKLGINNLSGLQVYLDKKPLNSSYSFMGYKSLITLNRLLNLFGLNIRQHSKSLYIDQLSLLRGDSVNSQRNYFLKESFFKKVLVRFVRYLDIRKILKINIFSKKKFNINQNLQQIFNIEKLKKNYENL